MFLTYSFIYLHTISPFILVIKQRINRIISIMCIANNSLHIRRRRRHWVSFLCLSFMKIKIFRRFFLFLLIHRGVLT